MSVGRENATQGPQAGGQGGALRRSRPVPSPGPVCLSTAADCCCCCCPGSLHTPGGVGSKAEEDLGRELIANPALVCPALDPQARISGMGVTPVPPVSSTPRP